MGKIAAHSYWNEWSTLKEGYNNIVAQQQEIEKEALSPKPTFVPPASMMKTVEKGVAQGGKLVAQQAPHAAIKALRAAAR